MKMILSALMIATVGENVKEDKNKSDAQTLSLKALLFCVVSFVVLSALCVSALFLSGFVPPQAIINSIVQDYEQIAERGDYPLFFAEAPKYRYDGFTDGIMLMQSIPDANRSALDNMVLAPYHAIGDGTPGGDGTGGISPTQALLNLLDDPENTDQQRQYILYWHGYVVPMRALLSVFSPMSIIVLNCLTFALLAVAVFEVFRRTGGLASALAFAFALLVSFSWIAPLGFQFFTMYLIAFLATLVLYWLLRRNDRHQWILPLFLTAGLLTAFFDFLTTPLLSFLLPLSLYLLWGIKTQKKDLFTKTVFAGAAWLVAYAGFWATKWLLAGVSHGFAYANSEFAYALAQRSGVGAGGLDYRIAAIYNNLYQLLSPQPDGSLSMGTFFLVLLAVLTLLTLLWLFFVKKTGTSNSQIQRALPMLLVVAGPYVWYFVVAHHSTFHSWFSYRLQFASVLGLLLFIILSVDWAKLKNKSLLAEPQRKKK